MFEAFLRDRRQRRRSSRRRSRTRPSARSGARPESALRDAHPARPRPLDPAAQRLHLPHAGHPARAAQAGLGDRSTSPAPSTAARPALGRNRRRLALPPHAAGRRLAPRCPALAEIGDDALDRARRARPRWPKPSSPTSCMRIRRCSTPLPRCAWAGARASRWSTRCAPSGKMPPSTMAPPAKAACATACRARWRRIALRQRRRSVHHLRRPARRHRRARHRRPTRSR